MQLEFEFDFNPKQLELPFEFDETTYNYKFTMQFPTEMGIEEYYIKTLNKPKFPEIHKHNEPFYVCKTPIVFEPLKIVYIKPIKPNETKILEWINLFYNNNYGRYGYTVGFKKNIIISQIDPLGNIIEKYTLVGCVLEPQKKQYKDFGELRFKVHFDRFIFKCD